MQVDTQEDNLNMVVVVVVGCVCVCIRVRIVDGATMYKTVHEFIYVRHN